MRFHHKSGGFRPTAFVIGNYVTQVADNRKLE